MGTAFGEAPSSPTDLVASQDEYRKHVWPICMWPMQWATCSLTLDWHDVTLDNTRKSDVPNTTGLYSLVVQPRVAGHPRCSYLMYVGKAVNLRKRFGQYLTRERLRRPKIIRLLEMYAGYIVFCYSRVEHDELKTMEDRLLSAFIPPCNSQFKGVVQGAQGAFS